MLMNSASVLPAIGLANLPKQTISEPTLYAGYCFISTSVSASGNNAVAIDNKIEQAMDLVKSHLMFAVREEVEVLKEKIAELMDRISHLEVENNLLRNNATPETLVQLNNLPQQVGTSTYQPTFNPTTGTLM